MDDAERAFRDALHRVDSVRIPVPLVDVAEVRRTRGRGPVVGRWLAAVAALALVAGLGSWVLAGRGQSVTAVPAAPSPVATPVALTGTTWIAVELYGRPATPAPEKVPFLEFRAGSTFHGGDPCNQFSGTYRLAGNDLTLSTFAKTEIGCNATQQQLFDKALASTRRVQRDGDTIELLDLPGSVLARFRSSGADTGPVPTPTATPSASLDPDTPTQAPELTPTPSATGTAASVQIRIRNASSVDFTDVYAVFPSGEKVHYGPVAAGSASGYEPIAQAYSYTYLKVTAAGKTYVWQPIDYAGESPLLGGRHYSYALDLVGSQVELTLQSDE